MPNGTDPVPADDEIRFYLSQKIPAYMVPAVFVPVDSIPHTAHGKVDRNALPAARSDRPKGLRQAEGDYEHRLVEIWKRVLNVEQLGTDDNFFDLGGHSLLLLRLNAEIKETFQSELAMIDLFRYPNIRSLAAKLAGTATHNGKKPGTEDGLIAGRRRLREKRISQSQSSVGLKG